MELTFLQQIILGILQGIFEWLPVSSSAFTVGTMATFFAINDLGSLIHMALFLHLGTFLAALVYFRKDVWYLIKTIFKYKKSSIKTKKILNFLIFSTVITGAIGIAILFLLSSLETQFELTGKLIILFVGILLLFTGILQIRVKKKGLKKTNDLKNSDGVILGITQGLATLPGVSRSGITISTLLLRNFDDTTALKLSFLMSLPIVLFGNILLNLSDFAQLTFPIWSLVTSFIFGLLTISGLIKLSKKVNFGWFALIFGLLMLISVFF